MATLGGAEKSVEGKTSSKERTQITGQFAVKRELMPPLTCITVWTPFVSAKGNRPFFKEPHIGIAG
jgi:hypothetical protein